MSHFLVGVVVPAEAAGNLEATIGVLLAPYDEALEVAPYPHECYCLETGIYAAASQVANEATGSSIAEYRTAFGETRRAEFELAGNPALGTDRAWEVEAVLDTKWKALVAPWFDAMDAEEARLKLIATPDPECEECSGTGTYESTYNPESKWDWWVIGGRWDGTIGGVERDMTGRFGLPGPGNWEETNNSSLVDRVFDDVVEDPPYAVVTPDGKWHARAKMGWFGISTGERDKGEWKDEVRDLLEGYRDCLIVGVDCHI